VPILPKVTNKGLQRFAITQSFWAILVS
jgi:hypothetical protein